MLLSLRYLALLWIAHRFVPSLNPCMIDRDACVPIEDFEVNCTCILTAKEPFIATDDVYMFFMGHKFPLYLFRHRTPDLCENSDKWCAEGECAAFVHREAPFNKSSGCLRSYGRFAPYNRDERTVKVGLLFRQFLRYSILLSMRHDQVAVTGDVKRAFADFVRASAIYNFRQKYAMYLDKYF